MTAREYNLICEALFSAHAAVVRSVNARSRKAQLANGRTASAQIEFALGAFRRAVAPEADGPRP